MAYTLFCLMFPKLVVYLTFLLPFRNHPNVIYDKLFEGRKFESFFNPLTPSLTPICHVDLYHSMLNYHVHCGQKHQRTHIHTHVHSHIHIHATYVYVVQESVGYQY